MTNWENSISELGLETWYLRSPQNLRNGAEKLAGALEGSSFLGMDAYGLEPPPVRGRGEGAWGSRSWETTCQCLSCPFPQGLIYFQSGQVGRRDRSWTLPRLEHPEPAALHVPGSSALGRMGILLS